MWYNDMKNHFFMADDQNLPIAAGNTGNSSGGGDGSAKPKKPKTEQQRIKERERRKRRRQKKLSQFKPGEDVPLVLSPKVGMEKNVNPPEDVQIVENKEQADLIEKKEEAAPMEIFPKEGEVSATEQSPITAEARAAKIGQPLYMEDDTVQEMPAAPEIVPPSEQDIVKEEFAPEPELTPEPEPAEVVEEAALEPSQAIFEESPTYGETVVEEKPQEDAHEEVVEELPQEEVQEVAPVDVLHEDDLENHKKNQAKQIMEDLHGEVESDELAELPQSKWIFGNLLKTVGGVILVIVLVIGAFWLGSSLRLPDLVKNWFSAKPVGLLAQGDNSKVVQDPDMLNHWGFMTARIFSRNLGDSRNLAYNIFYVANYFGRLKDPIFYGETGITAAIYYGFGRETQYFANKFVYYVKYLGEIRQANLVDVNNVLGGKVRRDVALDKYIADTQAIFDKGNVLRKEINVQIDDLLISINSLTSDHDRFQADFFASLEKIQAEQADKLILSFIANGQKQVELKAKMAALNRLTADYTDDLLKMKLNLEGLTKNRAALIMGVTVTPVPGSDINLVNQ